MPRGTSSWRVRYALVFLLVAAVYWPAGFYPFHPPPPLANHAVLAEDGGLELFARGIAYSKTVVSWQDDAIAAGQIEITLEIRPTSIEQEQAIIFALSTSDGHRDIIIGQHQRSLVIGYTRFDGAEYTRKSYYVPKVFRRADWQFIHIRLTQNHLAVFFDSDRVWEKELGSNPFASWRGEARVTLGNIPEFSYPWLGSIRSANAQISDRTYDFLDPRELELPAQYRRLDDRALRGFLDAPDIDYSTNQIHDWLVNFFGFFPLAAVAAFLWRRQSPIWAGSVVCVVTSLSIELTQIVLPWRTPSLHDVVLNSVGGVVGACVAVLVMRLLGKKRLARAATAQNQSSPLKNA